MDQSSLTEYKGWGGGGCRQLTANKGRGDHKNTPEPFEGGWGGVKVVNFIVKQTKPSGPQSPLS